MGPVEALTASTSVPISSAPSQPRNCYIAALQRYSIAPKFKTIYSTTFHANDPSLPYQKYAAVIVGSK
jgi:hypothetical protein